jgi:hypothetical protein
MFCSREYRTDFEEHYIHLARLWFFGTECCPTIFIPRTNKYTCPRQSNGAGLTINIITQLSLTLRLISSAHAASFPDSPPKSSQISNGLNLSSTACPPTTKSPIQEAYSPEAYHKALFAENSSYTSLNVTQSMALLGQRPPPSYHNGAISSLSNFSRAKWESHCGPSCIKTLFSFSAVTVVKR